MRVVAGQGVMLAFPYLGELGWEIMHWQARLRSISERGQRVAVCASEESKVLYRDFCHAFHPHNITSKRSRFCMSGDDAAKADAELLASKLVAENEYVDVIRPGETAAQKETPEYASLPDKAHPKYLSLRSEGPVLHDVVIHARCKGLQCYRNYSFRSWERLIRQMGGLRMVALRLPGAYDMSRLGIDTAATFDLEQSARVISRSRVFVGPDSAALHLAALTMTPRITWLADPGSGSGYRTRRINSFWNPFKVETRIVSSDDFQPDPGAVLAKIMDLLEMRGARR